MLLHSYFTVPGNMWNVADYAAPCVKNDNIRFYDAFRIAMNTHHAQMDAYVLRACACEEVFPATGKRQIVSRQ